MSIEDKSQSQLQLGLSKASSYLLGVAQLKANQLEQQILFLCDSKYSGNETKKLIKMAADVIDKLGSVFKELAIMRSYKVVKKATDSLFNISIHLVQALDKYKQRTNSIVVAPQVHGKVNYVPKTQVKISIDEGYQIQSNLKKNKMKGVCLYNENYKRKIDPQAALQQQAEAAKRKKQQEQRQHMSQRQFKKKLFDQMKKQLKQVQEDIYSPFPDDISTFLIFQRKFLQSFNHLSRVQDIEVLLKYLQNSRISALDLVNKTEDMSEQVSKLKSEIQELLKQAKLKGEERDKKISNRFQQIIKGYLQKRVKMYETTKQKMQKYQKLAGNKQSKRVSIGVQTHVKQFSALKTLEKKANEIQNKFRFRQQERERSFKAMIKKSDDQKMQLNTQIMKYKIENKVLNEEIQQCKKQNAKIIQKLYEKKGSIAESSQIDKNRDSKNEQNSILSGGQQYFMKRKQKKTSLMSSLSKTNTQKENVVTQSSQISKKQSKILNSGKDNIIAELKQMEDESKTYQVIKIKSLRKNDVQNKNQFLGGDNNQQDTKTMIQRNERLQQEDFIQSYGSKDALIEDLPYKKKFESQALSVLNNDSSKYLSVTRSAVLLSAANCENILVSSKDLINTAHVISKELPQKKQVLKYLPKNEKAFEQRMINKEHKSISFVQIQNNKQNRGIERNINQYENFATQLSKGKQILKRKSISNSFSIQPRVKTEPFQSLHNTLSQPRNISMSKNSIQKLSPKILKQTGNIFKSKYKKNAQDTFYQNIQSKRQPCCQMTKLYSISVNSGKVVQFQNKPVCTSQPEIEYFGYRTQVNEENHKLLSISGHPIKKKNQVNFQNNQENQKNNKYYKLAQSRYKKLANKYSNSLHLGRSFQKTISQKDQALNNSDFCVNVKGFYKAQLPNIVKLDNSYEYFQDKEAYGFRVDSIDNKLILNSSKDNSLQKKKLARQLQILNLKKKIQRYLPSSKPHESPPHQKLLMFEKAKIKDNEKLKKMWRKKSQFGSVYKRYKCDQVCIATKMQRLPQINVKSLF